MEIADGKKLKITDYKNCVILYQDESAFVSESSQYNWSERGVKALFKGYRYGTRINCFGSFDIKTSKLILTQEARGNSQTMIKHLEVVRANYPMDKKLIIFLEQFYKLIIIIILV